MVQASFANDSINLVVANVEALVVKATRDLFGTPFIPLPQFDYFLFERTVKSKTARATSGFFF